MIRAYKEVGCRGIGEICANIPITDPRYLNLFAHAQAEKMPLLFHVASRRGELYGVVDKPGLPGLAQALTAFPKGVVLGHGPAFWSEIDGNLKPRERDGYPRGPITKKGALWLLFTRHPNLYGDLSAGSAHNALSRDPAVGRAFLRRFHRQLCFGTDRFTKDAPIPPMLGLMNEARRDKALTQAQYDNIMWRNARRILKNG